MTQHSGTRRRLALFGFGAGEEAELSGEARAISRRVVFWIEIVYLAILAWAGWLYLAGALPSWLKVPSSLGPMPVGVIWYGALGGVLISLTGVFEHRYDWDARYFFWHAARPLVGSACAVVAVLLIQSGILATGSDPGDTTAETTDVFYYLVAFLVGYREATFRGLMKRLTDVFLTSEESGKAPTITRIAPAKASPGESVTIVGSGFTGAETVRFGLEEAEFEFVSDTQLAAVVPPGTGSVAVIVASRRGTGAPAAFEFA